MKITRRYLTMMVAALLLVFVLACDTSTSSQPSLGTASQKEAQTMENTQQRLLNAYPIPQLTKSMERKNLIERATRLNKDEAVGYVYLLSHGNVMAFYTVRGKVTSLNAYLTPDYGVMDDPNGSIEAGSLQIETPDVDGAYGKNDDGIFFFTTEGVYVEWNGEYLFSDQPLRVSQPVQLTQGVK